MSSWEGRRWKHKKRGTVYEIITDAASLQMACDPEVEARYEDDHFMVYRNVETGAIYIRPSDEFLDGRFEQIA